jgi:hypothetical protein
VPRISYRCRDHTHASRLRARRPVLEGLEDRFLLYATNGGHWTYPARVTYSFMPDGTSVGGTPSSLFQTMGAVAPTATWQLQFQKAAAVWEAVAHINLVQVPDSGLPDGFTGNQQGDPNAGDIRIGAIPEQGGQLAFAFLPPPKNGGTDAGDIVFNSTVAWQIGTGYDLETVAIHEIGHALGMDHSQIQQAVMYACYNGVKQSLNSDDVAGIQSIYGAPTDPTNNCNSSTAIDITSLIDGNGQIALGGQYIASAADQDWYKVTVPASTTGTMTVSVQSTNLSELSPKVTIYNSSVQGIAQAASPYTYGSTATVTILPVLPGQVYYIRAMAANTGATGVGAYGLLVNFTALPQSPIAPPNTVVASAPDQGGGTSPQTTGHGHRHPHHSHAHAGGLADQLGTVHAGTLSGQGDFLMATVRSIPRGRHRRA